MNNNELSVPKIMVNMEEVVDFDKYLNNEIPPETSIRNGRESSCLKSKCWPCSKDFSSFFVLVFISLIAFFTMISYDLPGSLESQIESTFNVKTYQFEYLYSVYCFPNIVLAFFGGILIDKVLGVKRSGLLICTIVLTGQVLFTIGGFARSYWLLLFARFIFGVGGDSILVVSNYYTVLWFNGKAMNFVFGLVMSFSRLGTSFVFLISPSIYKWLKGFPIKKEKIIGATFSMSIMAAILLLLNMLALGWESERKGKLNVVKSKKEKDDEKNNFSFKEIFIYPFKYWMVSTVFISVQATVLVFVTCSQRLFISKYKVDSLTADHYGSVYNLALAVTAPLAGIFIDKFGRNLLIMNLSLLGASISQITFILPGSTPYISILLFGISCGVLLSVVLPLTSKVVPATQLGAAFGLMISMTDLSQTVLNIAAGYLLEEHGHVAVCLFYLALLLAGLLSGLLLWVFDKIDGGDLQKGD